jgi:peptidoglycan/LPS O-acetylase OafA/YrhL
MLRLKRLDGLRGVLAIYVMLGHASPFAAVPPLLAAPFRHGEAAVDLFFALSGLVIINSLEHFNYRFWPFIRARARRLLPVYFAVLALATILLCLGSPLTAMPWIAHRQAALQIWAMTPPHNLLAHIAAHVFLAQGIIPQGILPYVWVSLLGPAWSLSTEFQFYLLIALVLGRLPAAHRLQVSALGLLALAVIYHLAAPHFPPYWQFSRAFLPDAAEYFALGLASAVWLRGGGSLLLIFCIIAASALGLDTTAPTKALIPLGWALALLIQRHPSFPLLGSLLDSRAATYLGAISYPLYLLNEPIQRGLALLIAPLAAGDQTRFTLLWLPLAVTMPILAAALLHHVLEKPAMHWRRGAPDKATAAP